MKYCNNCGASMEDSAVFCGQCGKTVGNSANIPNQRGPVQNRPMQSGPVQNANTPNKPSLLPWIGMGIAVVLLVAIGVAYFFFSDAQKKADSFIPGATQSSVANNAAPATTANPTNPAGQTLPAGSTTVVSQPITPTPQINATVLNDFRSYVQAKERLNTQIIELATQVNGRINQTGGLRNSQDLKGRAQMLINEINQQSGQLSGKSYPPEFQRAKTSLVQLFDLEATRVQSLYNGLLEGSNGQDYLSSFSVGTSAAYKFDDENSKFIQENGMLDSMVKP